MGRRGPKKEAINKALKEAHLTAIGRVAAQWSYLEMQLRLEITDLAKLEMEVGLAMLSPLNFAQWLDLVSFFLKRTPALRDREEQWKVLRKELDDLRVERNDVVHAFWRAPRPMGLLDSALTGHPQEIARGVNIPKGIGKELKSVLKSPAEIRDLAKRIRVAYYDLSKLLNPTIPTALSGREKVVAALVKRKSGTRAGSGSPGTSNTGY